MLQISDYLDLPKDGSDEAKVAGIGEVLEVGEPVWVKVRIPAWPDLWSPPCLLFFAAPPVPGS